jgi:molybdenum cofactor cytidylyltransferase
MSGAHKLMLPWRGEPMVRRTVRAVVDAGPEEVVVVTGFNSEAVSAALSGLPVRIVLNARHDEGQMTSAAAGVGALAAVRPAANAEGSDAVMVCLADMPLLEAADYRELIDAYTARARGSIVLPWRDGRRGNPVVFSARHVPAVIAGSTNMACRKLVADHPGEVVLHIPHHDRFFIDLDTPEDYAAALAARDKAVPA